MTGRWRVGVALAVAAVSGLSLAVAPPAQARESRDRYAIGDSVMLGARTALKSAGFGVDAAESRQAYAGPSLLRRRGEQLPRNVVVHLGTNGTYRLDDCKALVRAAGSERRVFLVTIRVPRSWERRNNAVIRRCDAAFAADRVHVVDWAGAAADNPRWLYADGIHLRPEGAVAFTRLIDEAVDDAVRTARRAALSTASGSGTAAVVG